MGVDSDAGLWYSRHSGGARRKGRDRGKTGRPGAADVGKGRGIMFLPRARYRKEHSRVAPKELLRRYFTDEFCAMANSVKIVVLNATPDRACRLTENHR